MNYLAFSIVYNRYTQLRALRDFAVGVAAFEWGRSRECRPPEQTPSRVLHVIKEAGGLALVAGGIVTMELNAYRLLQLTDAQWKYVFEFGQPPTLREPSRYEKILDFNRFGKMPTRADVLFLSPLSYTTDPKRMPYSPYVMTLFTSVEQFEYKYIEHPMHICEKIQEASSAKNKILNLVINAHAATESMEFSDISQLKTFDPLPAGCFDGLAQRARIFLIACKTGLTSTFRPSLAEWLSWVSGRRVVASGCTVDDVNMNISYTANTQRVDMRFKDPDTLLDCTVDFHVTGSWTETGAYLSKAALSGLRGAFTAWQMVRLSATLLQASGFVIQVGVQQSAPYAKQVAACARLYHPTVAQCCYTGSMSAGKLLYSTGKTMHQGMDRVINSVNQSGLNLLKKGASFALSLFTR